MNRLSIFIIALSLVSCLSKDSKTSESETRSVVILNTEEELKAIEAVRTNFSAALKEGRYEDMGLYVTKNAKTIRPGGAGWDAMFALGQERGRFPYDSIIMQPMETHIISDSMAYDFGTSRVFYTNKDGQPIELNNSFLVLLKKENGQWKLHREVGSSIVN